ncbi:Rieske (2Fe-2S) protein, partial [Sporosarcina sp. P16b]
LQQAKAFQEGQEPLVLENQSLKTLYSEGLYDDKEKKWQEAFPLKEQFEKKQAVENQ